MIRDADGDRLDVERMRTGAALISIGSNSVLVDLEDGLALLSFLADALGVERYVPSDALAMVSPPEPAPGGDR
jgi:hypothetical protein